ncbi:MAG: transporter related protein [Alphaproteobacteria bacterium]|nr:transporter related protein [Alphaproteobacteria bacterium]
MRTMDGLRILARHVRPNRGRVVVAAMAFVVKDSPLWVLPIITAEVIDLLIARSSPVALVGPASAAAGVIVINLIANAIYVRHYFFAVRELGLRLRGDIAAQLQTLSIGYHARSSSAIAQTKLVRDVENLELMLQQSFGPVLNSASIIVGAGITIAIRMPVFLAVIGLTVPLAVVLMHWLRTRTAAANEEFRRDIEFMSSRASEMGALLPITRAHGLETIALDRLGASTERVRASGLRLDRINGRFGAMSWASFQLLSLFCLFGAVGLSLTSIVSVTAGEVVLLSSYFGLLTGTLVNAFQLAPLVTRGFESLASVDEILSEDEVEDNTGKYSIGAVHGRIQFDHVSFHYGGKNALTDFDLTIKPGQSIALVGPSGSGKSTILNLALGLLTPQSGKVTVNGHDLRHIDLRTYRRHVSVVPQEPVLFGGSVKENVAYGLAALDDEVIWDALDRANAANFVRELPQGWDTLVGERGNSLSGGQRQRIAIARALVRNPKILLLDEATSALDPEAEVLVRDAINELRRGRTTLIVAHRLSTIRTADFLAVLEEGRVMEFGTHEQLAATGRRYRQLLAASIA